MNKHEYVGFTVEPEWLVKRWEQDAVARRLGLKSVSKAGEGRHRAPGHGGGGVNMEELAKLREDVQELKAELHHLRSDVNYIYDRQEGRV
ncbi:hypothetical protein FGG24_gp67 [Mycobacterium phage JC27]|uniref:Uncharacterized protein n=2 Tax=Viruses TaxID=10239 RepID=G1D3B6_9CAUD|nr:hypothetical protein FGG24_gp67 [Mycobacterium phage JC27]AEK09262.1 hypothetical protein PBI_JC27_67 [Mycobacterium phage JC27]